MGAFLTALFPWAATPQINGRLNAPGWMHWAPGGRCAKVICMAPPIRDHGADTDTGAAASLPGWFIWE